VKDVRIRRRLAHGLDGALWILIPLLFAVLVWAAIKGTGTTKGSSESAEEILKRRYARGELDEETFRRMRDELRRS
jgi:putative membrane protein